jgi:hypothetical protein
MPSSIVLNAKGRCAGKKILFLQVHDVSFALVEQNSSTYANPFPLSLLYSIMALIDRNA